MKQVEILLLQKNLDEKYGEGSYEVIILAKPGYSTLDELRVLKEIGLKFDPDIVILGYYLNDAEGPNSRIGFENLFFHHYIVPYELGRWLYSHSFAYYTFESRFKNIHKNLGWERGKGEKYIENLYDQKNPFFKVHRKILASYFKHLEDKTKIVINIPLLTKSEEYPFNFVTTYVKEISENNGAHFVDLLPIFNNYEPSELKVSSFDNHLNELGHKLVSEMIFNKIVELEE